MQEADWLICFLWWLTAQDYNLLQMISAEAPVLFAKAAQIFITELTLRAWIHTEDNKRRTLQVMQTHIGKTRASNFSSPVLWTNGPLPS